MLVQQCNVSLIQVVLSLSLGDVGDLDGLAVCEDDAFAGFEGFPCGNLDGFYSCDMIGLVHDLYTETVQLHLGGFSFLSAGPRTPVSPRWKTKTGAWHGKSMSGARLAYVGYFGLWIGVICLLWGQERPTREWVCRLESGACSGNASLLLGQKDAFHFL